MARSTYYYHLKSLNEPDKNQHIINAIKAIYHKHKGRYGYRRITMELRKTMLINCKKVARLMKQIGLKSLVRIKKYRSYRGQEGRIAPNILKRDFTASSPNQKWATDVTEFALLGQKLYLSPILDMYNGEIINYSISKSPNMKLITDMLAGAFQKLKTSNDLVLHSDQGWHYQNPTYRKALSDNNIKQSMSRKGNCLDNAVMENFFGILKSELFYLQKFQSIEEFKKELKLYIDYYNNDRIKGKLKGLSPVEFRTQS